jgi:DNA-binding GntR family transcriptional regulator
MPGALHANESQPPMSETPPSTLVRPYPESPLEAPAPIARRSLHDEVVTRIRDMIIEGVLAPGARVHEGQLGVTLGVSRTPLREALKFLASEGLIELVAARGAVVKKFTAKDVRDMLDVLAVLEGFAGRLACREASDADIVEVRRLHDRMVERYEVRDRLEYFKLNQQIHSSLLRLSNNAALEASHASIQSRLKRIRYIGNQEPHKWRDALDEHEAMIRYFEARDGENLARILVLHMEHTWERVKLTL